MTNAVLGELHQGQRGNARQLHSMDNGSSALRPPSWLLVDPLGWRCRPLRPGERFVDLADLYRCIRFLT